MVCEAPGEFRAVFGIRYSVFGVRSYSPLQRGGAERRGVLFALNEYIISLGIFLPRAPTASGQVVDY